MAHTVATIKYNTKPGIAVEFLRLIHGENFQKTVSGYPGFISYHLVNPDADTWCEYILWETKEAAISGAKDFQTAPAKLELLPYFILTSFNSNLLETTVSF